MRFLGVLACLLALLLTGYSAIVYKAPKVQADIQVRVEQALAGMAGEPIEVTVDGREVTLRGTVSDDGERARLLLAAGSVWGGLGPVDGLRRLTVMAPYRFEATKHPDGGVVIKGVAPSSELRELMRADAEAIFGEGAEVRIDLAAGAPEGDWRGIAGLGMDALATLDRGRLVISDQALSLVSEDASPSHAQAIEIFADAAPEGFVWASDLGVPDQAAASIEQARPFSMTVSKRQDGSFNIQGFAPDDATRKAMIDQAKTAAGDRPVVADIQIADGMPNAGWPELVFAGIGAMAQVEAGKYRVVGNDVSFEGDVREEAEPAAALAADARPRAASDQAESRRGDAVDSLNQDRRREAAPVSPYVMTVYKSDDGALWLQGVTPDASTRDDLVGRLKETVGVDEINAEIDFAEGMPGDDWRDFIADRAVALKAVKSGSLSFKDYDSHLIGVVETPEDVDLVETRIAAIDSAMTADLTPEDSRSAAALDLVVSSEKGVTIWGSLPDGMTEKEAAMALGLAGYQGGLSGDARGDAEVWRQSLAAIGGYLPEFEHVGITFTDASARVKGKLHPNSDVERVTAGLTSLFGPERDASVDVSTTELIYDDGTTRKNPLTGKDEVYDRGYWLPIVAFAPGLDECRKQSSAILDADKITFLRGETTLDGRAERIIDGLAAIAARCLENDGLALEIGGHTDARGDEEMNQALSQDRADAVLRALSARGLDATSVVATGYGERQPVADNDTDEGRARNRRITFEWRQADQGQESGPEG